MGYWVGRDSQRFYIEGNTVFNVPGGSRIAIDPVTLEAVKDVPKDAPVAIPEPSNVEPLPVNVLEDFKDETKIEAFIKEGKNVKPLEHAKECRSGGRWGRYTENCPKCEFLKKSK